MKKNKIIGYTAGVFDLFHIGHLSTLRKARKQCDHLIVGVTTDELSEERKKKSPIIPYGEREQIVASIKYVNEVVAQEDMNKFGAWEKFDFNKMFVGEDWKGTSSWDKYEKQFAKVAVEIIYLPLVSTDTTSSTVIREILYEELDKRD